MDIEELVALIGGGTILFTVLIIVITVFCTGTPFVVVGWYLYRSWKRGKIMEEHSQGWASTAGVVTKSRVEVSGGETTSVYPKIVYEYGVGGQTYQNDNIRPGDDHFSANFGSRAYDIVDQYPVGSAVIVYYNPANPAQSSLER
jgi:hypothetical protein